MKIYPVDPGKGFPTHTAFFPLPDYGEHLAAFLVFAHNLFAAKIRKLFLSDKMLVAVWIRCFRIAVETRLANSGS